MTGEAVTRGGPSALTSNERDAARSRRLFRGIASSFASRGLSALVPLAMVPIMLPALGSATYGSWMTIVSITAMFTWADLGLGSGLLTRLSKHLANADVSAARRDILTTYSIVTLVGGVLGALTLVSPLFVSWAGLLNASGTPVREVDSIALVCLSIFFANMPLSLIQRVQYAAQEVNVSNLFTALGPMISLVLTLAATAGAQSTALVVCSATIGPLIANIAATAHFFSRNRALIPLLVDRRGAEPLVLISLGSLFVLITVFSSLAINSDNMVVAHTLGTTEVAEYAVAARVMGAMGLIIGLVNLPLWPATASALARGDTAWVRRTTRRMALASGAFVAIACCVILLVSGPLVSVLSHGLVERDLALLAFLGVWWTVVAVTSPAMMVQNAAGVLKPQLIGWALFLIVSLPMKVLAVPRLGLYAGPLVGAICYATLVLPSALFGYRRSMCMAVGSVKDGCGIVSAEESEDALG